MKYKIYGLIGLIILIMSFPVNAAENTRINLLQPTGETKEGLSVYKEGGDYPVFNEMLHSSFVQEAIQIYEQASYYNKQSLSNINVIFKENSGCYGGIGFYLKCKDGQYKYIKEPFIELGTFLLEDQATLPLTFSHELGHVMSKSIIPQNDEREFYTTNMHYASVTTDYHTAFTEGFGEHFEVIGREYEINKDLADFQQVNLEEMSQVKKAMMKVSRDFILPLRLDYYRLFYPVFQGQDEAYRRYAWIKEGKAKYENAEIQTGSVKEMLLYHNMGIDKSDKIGSIQQNLAKESVLSQFFVNLIKNSKGSLNERYKKVFNAFSKIEGLEVPEIIQFIKVYIAEYPEERENILDAYKESTGYAFDGLYAPEIWLYNQTEGNMLILDQFDSLTSPLQAVNLNTCSKEDLMQVRGMKTKQAESIIVHRSKIGWFGSIEELKDINGLSKETIQALVHMQDKAYVKACMTEYEKYMEGKFTSLNMSMLFKPGIANLFKKTNIQFIIGISVFGLIIIVRRKKYKEIFKHPVRYVMIKCVKYNLLALWGAGSTLLACAMSVSALGGKNYHPVLYFVPGISIVMLGSYFAFRKNSNKRKDSLLSTVIMGLAITYSLL